MKAMFGQLGVGPWYAALAPPAVWPGTRGLGFLNLSLLISKMGMVLIPFPQGVRIERDNWALGLAYRAGPISRRVYPPGGVSSH